jgi:hypothetical protein
MSLTKTQTQRLGKLLGVMFGDNLPQEALQEPLSRGLIEKRGNEYGITEKGLDEKNRLCTLAGLNIKYQFERDRLKAQ